MNAVAALLGLGLTLGQPPAGDYVPIAGRSMKLPINFKDRTNLQKVLLFVSADQGQTWTQESSQLPNAKEFQFTAPKDGVYWFNMVEVDRQGKKYPPDLTRDPDALKVMMDATPPQVTFTTARRNGDEVVVEWAVDERFPKDDATRVSFRPVSAPDDQWQTVTIPAGSRNGVRFPVSTPGPVLVKVSVADLVGHKNEAVKEIGGGSAVAAAPPTGVVTAATGTGAAVPPLPEAKMALPPPAAVVSPPADLASLPAGPAAPLPPAAPAPLAPAAPAAPPPAAVAPPAPAGAATPPAPAFTFGPSEPTPIASGRGVPAAPPAPPAAAPAQDLKEAVTPAGGNSAVIATGSGVPGGPPSVEVSRTQVVNLTRFDIAYEVEQRGPSGVSRVDLWVTRDDGLNWVRWSQHDGRDSTVRVVLDGPNNPTPEGTYGFRLVPVSGAGLSDGAPVNGRTRPDMRVVVDTTPPLIDLYQPGTDRNAPDALVLKWKAIDANMGADPITLEWSDLPTGPWKPVAAASEPTVQQVAATTAAAAPPAARRLPNTGEFAWRVPHGLPPKVYLKVTARDAAGNVSEVITPQPITVDTMTPKARIQGIVTGPPQVRP